MHDAETVGVLHGTGQRLDQPGRIAGGPGGAVESVRQAAPGHVLHLEKGPAPVIADPVDLDDLRVLEPGHRLGFGQEPCGGLGPGEVSGQNHFEGDEPVEPLLARLEDDPHPPPTQLAEDRVARDRRHRTREPDERRGLALLQLRRRLCEGRVDHGRVGREMPQVILGGRPLAGPPAIGDIQDEQIPEHERVLLPLLVGQETRDRWPLPRLPGLLEPVTGALQTADL